MKNNRRDFLKQSAVVTGSAALGTVFIPSCASDEEKKQMNTSEVSSSAVGSIVGHGDFKYRINKEWGIQDQKITPVLNCHEMMQDAKGRIFLSNTHTKNNVIIYDTSGKVLNTWGNDYPGLHGLTIHDEGGEEFLYLTDPDIHKAFKTTLDGKVLMTFEVPKEISDYESPDQFCPTETVVGPNGDIYITDGYGKSFVIQYDSKGNYIRHFGGLPMAKKDDYGNDLKDENGTVINVANPASLNCSHGVVVDYRDKENPTLIVTSRGAQEFKRFTLDGKYISTTKTPGAWICRPVIKGDYLYFAVIVTKSWWSHDGCLVILDKNDKVVAAPGALAPKYVDGELQTIEAELNPAFLNPHDVCVDADDNIYIAQWFSGRTYPVKLERV